jgi:hypothetical protein
MQCKDSVKGPASASLPRFTLALGVVFFGFLSQPIGKDFPYCDDHMEVLKC